MWLSTPHRRHSSITRELRRRGGTAGGRATASAGGPDAPSPPPPPTLLPLPPAGPADEAAADDMGGGRRSRLPDEPTAGAVAGDGSPLRGGRWAPCRGTPPSTGGGGCGGDRVARLGGVPASRGRCAGGGCDAHGWWRTAAAAAPPAPAAGGPAPDADGPGSRTGGG